MEIRTQVARVLLIDVAKRIVPIKVWRILVATISATASSTAATRIVVVIHHVTIVSLDLVVDIVGTTSRTTAGGSTSDTAASASKRTRVLVAFAAVARQQILSRVASKVIPIVVGSHSGQHLIIKRLRLLLLRSSITAVQIATIVEIVQASCLHRWWTSGRRPVRKIVDHIGRPKVTPTNGSIVERLLLRIFAGRTCRSVLVHIVVRVLLLLD